MIWGSIFILVLQFYFLITSLSGLGIRVVIGLIERVGEYSFLFCFWKSLGRFSIKCLVEFTTGAICNLAFLGGNL